MPGAVPVGFGMTRLPAGNIACTVFCSGMSRAKAGKEGANVFDDMFVQLQWGPANCASTSRVRSSAVGPNPPVAITTSTR